MDFLKIRMTFQWKSGGWAIRTMAWKDDMLAMGDAEGRIVRVIVMGTEALTRQHQITLDTSRSALDMDLCGVSPVLLTNDNVLRYAPAAAKNSPMLEKDIPLLLNAKKVEQVKKDFESSSSENPALWKIAQRKVTASPSAGDVVDLSRIKNQMLLSRFLGETSERELQVTCAACSAGNIEESRLVERAVVAGGKAKDRAVDRLIGSSDLRHASMKAALLVSSQ
ncbi:hypothetical protein ANCDUO_20849, partial [Ancylostoma duodenale]